MNKEDRKKYIRLIFSRTFQYLSIALVVSLLLGTILSGGIYMMYSACAAGFVMIGWGWFTYLYHTDSLPFSKPSKNEKPKVPYILRRFKGNRHHRPSFRMDSRDFDDDLTSATSVNQEIFSKKQTGLALAFARAICGGLLVLFSFFIPIS